MKFKNPLKNPKTVLIIVLILLLPLIALSLTKHKVLGAKTVIATPSPSPAAAFHTVSPPPESSATPTPAPQLSKSTYQIALFGDSMIDTMGDMKYLSDALAKKYPKTSFRLYNYGIGAQNAQVGLDRLNSAFNYMDRKYPPLKDINADVIIMGSFAYNPFVNHDVAKYASTLTTLINQTRSFNKNIYQLIEIAPLKENFGKGPHGINWPPDLAARQSQHIDEQLTAARNVAKALAVPIIDVYPFTVGRTMFTNPDDGIHPSVDGHTLIANLIVKTILLK